MVQPFKVGPDFIDPGHHTRVAGRVSRNLDGWMLTQAANRGIFAAALAGADMAVVEGVMGLFDGFEGQSEAGSTAQMAKWLGLPVLLVVDARSMARSAAALVHGFATFDPKLTLAGVVFNRVGSAAHRQYLEEALAQVSGVRCLGALPREAELAIPERHLGLVTAEDHAMPEPYLDRLADLMETHMDLDGLLAALPEVDFGPPSAGEAAAPEVRLAVARDAAFCFYYQDNLDLLAQSGAELAPFSPLSDAALPDAVHGLYLGGGYPELYAAPLAANAAKRGAIRAAANAGMPIYAECGGLMYLGREIVDLEGAARPMAGVLPFQVRMLPKLKALGYREVTFTSDCLLGPAGMQVRGHEFHYSEIISGHGGLPQIYRLTPRRGEAALEGYAPGNVLASYVHLHFASNPAAARHLVDACRRYKETL
jgi:cobyrinic acid a,c-diamide synthase